MMHVHKKAILVNYFYHHLFDFRWKGRWEQGLSTGNGPFGVFPEPEERDNFGADALRGQPVDFAEL